MKDDFNDSVDQFKKKDNDTYVHLARIVYWQPLDSKYEYDLGVFPLTTI